MRIRLVIPCCCFILFLSQYSYSQSGPTPNIDQVAGKFIKMLQADPKEKIDVYTDRWIYQSGEEIWFRAYCLNSLSGKPLYQSKNLFLDLVDDKDSIISQLLMNLQEGRTGGKLSLPASLKEGYYWIRAYTSTILHQDSNRIFVKPLFILNGRRLDLKLLSAYNAKPAADAIDTSMPRMSFLPEGGSVISGTTATIAFRALTASGKPLNVSGYITDSRDSTVASFNSTLPGMGKFSFDAWNHRKYFAHIKWNNRVLTYPLPAINQFASQLSLIDQTDQVFHIRVSQGDSLYKKNKTTFILGISRDSLCFAANGTDMYDVNIPKNIFPKGKASLLLFDEHGQIVSQRALYIDSSLTRVVVVADKPNYGSREKVKLNISISGADNHPINALFSVSVTDDRFARQIEEQNQPSGLYADNVELPEADLLKKYSPEEMDLIMLTQKGLYPGWKYGDEIAAPLTHEEANNLFSIEGIMVSKNNEPMHGYLVNLFSDQKGMFKFDTTDDKGHFHFALPDFDDGSKFNLKLTTLKGQGQEGRVILDKSAFPQFNTPLALKKGFSSAELDAIRNFKAHQLDTIPEGTEKGVLTSVTVKPGGKVTYDESKRVSRFSTIITPDKFNNGDPNALPNAVKQVPGLNRGLTMGPGGSATGEPPLVVVDGVAQSLPSSDVNSYLMSLDPNTIDFVEILKGAETAMYGMQGAGGVILINSKNTRKDVAEIDVKGQANLFPKGYYKEPTFTFPDYSKPELKNSAYRDLRSTLYWKGNILTNSNGKEFIEFFTNDGSTTYTVNLMGVTDTGEFIYKQIKIRRE
jgi:hypothetical protein